MTTKFWKVPPIWRGHTAYIIAGGPSVLSQDLDLLKGQRVVVVNSSYTAYPNADFLIFADQRWWDKFGATAKKDFKGRIVSVSKNVRDPEVLHLGRVEAKGLSSDPTKVPVGKTTLHAAINLCVHLGAARIVLLGADMGRAEDGSTHHHDPHPWKNKDGNLTWDRQMPQLRLIAGPLASLGVEIVNTSMASRIDWWPKVSLEDVAKSNWRPKLGTKDSREYDQLKKRKFRPYSRGHQMMYLTSINLMSGVIKQTGRKYRVVEAGFGIGWGLEQMLAAKVLDSYTGFEPNADSFNYVAGRHKEPGVALVNEPFSFKEGGYDAAFCIEVIEHVPDDLHGDFLSQLRASAPLLFFSTPDIERSREGVRRTDEWVRLLNDAGFASVTVNKDHWTHLYVCR